MKRTAPLTQRLVDAFQGLQFADDLFERNYSELDVLSERITADRPLLAHDSFDLSNWFPKSSEQNDLAGAASLSPRTGPDSRRSQARECSDACAEHRASREGKDADAWTV